MDRGEKRWTLNRPGVERIKELCARGGVDAVIAWRWDRFGESPWPEVLAIELEEYGVALRSLDDGGEGEDAEILRALRGAMAKKERRRTTERSRMGTFAKARRGEISGSAFAPRYGFRYVKNERGKAAGYAVDPDKMANVRRILTMLAEGESVHGVRRMLERGGIPAPGGSPRWSRTTIRNVAVDDAYLPRTYNELEEMVSAAVLAGLDPEKEYGIAWFGRHRSRYTGKGNARKVKEVPRENWVAIPIDLTGSGLERATVERARALVSVNRSSSKVEGRFWELSGGVLRCASCGRAMTAYRRARRPEGTGYRYYYRCRPNTSLDVCSNRKSHRAEDLEEAAWRLLRDAYNRSGELLRMFDEDTREQYRRLGLGETQRGGRRWRNASHGLTRSGRRSRTSRPRG